MTGDALLCHDPWDWKTDAPEFIPASYKGFAEGTWDVQPQLPAGGAIDSGKAADASSTHSAASDLAQLRVQYERQLSAKAQAIRELQCRAQQLELETAQMRASRELERRGHLRQLDRCRAILQRYCIPLEEANCTSGAGSYEVLSGVDSTTHWELFARQGVYVPSFRPLQVEPWGLESSEASGGRTAAELTCHAPETANSGRSSSSSRCRTSNGRSWGLDSDSILQEGTTGGGYDRRKHSGISSIGPVSNSNQQPGNSREIPAEVSNGDIGLGAAWASRNATKASTSVALTLSEMFPHAKIHTEEPEVCRQDGDRQQETQMQEVQAAEALAAAATAAGAAELQPEADQLAPEPSDPEAVQAIGSRLGLLERTVGRLTDEPARNPVHEDDMNGAEAEDGFDRFGQLIDVKGSLTPVLPKLEWNDSSPSQLLNENGPSSRASSDSIDTSAACDGVAGNSSNIAGDSTQFVDGPCSPSHSQGPQFVDTPASKRSWADISDEDACLFGELPASLPQTCAESVDLAIEDEEKTTSCSA